MNKREFLSLSLKSAALPAVLMSSHPYAWAAPSQAGRPGTLDLGFGDRGLVIIPSPFSQQDNMVIFMTGSGTDQHIYVGGAAGEDTMMCRLLDDGDLDTRFGVNGYAMLPPYSEEHGVFIPRAILSQDDDGVVFLGEVGTAFDDGRVFDLPATCRMTLDGALDLEFGDRGMVIYRELRPKNAQGQPVSHAQKMALFKQVQQRPVTQGDPATEQLLAHSQHIQRDANNEVVCMVSVYDGYYPYAKLAGYLIKIKQNGRLDPTFGQQGMVDIGVLAEAFDIDRFNRVIVGGVIGSGNMGTVTRYDPHGQPDATFGSAGVVLVPNPRGAGVANRGVKTLYDGAVVASFTFVGTEDFPPSQFPGLIKLAGSNGAVDPQFNNGQPLILELPSPYSYRAYGLSLDDGQRIIVNGGRLEFIGNGFTLRAQMSRVLPAGFLDTSFGFDGHALFENMPAPFQSTSIQNKVKPVAYSVIERVVGDPRTTTSVVVRLNG